MDSLSTLSFSSKNSLSEELDHLKGVLSKIFENSPNIIFVKDKQGQYVMANNVAAGWLETTVDAMLGKTDRELFPPDVAKEIQSVDQQVLKSTTLLEYEETIFKSGKSQRLATKKMPWFDSDNNLLGLIGICQDITERRESAAILQQSKTKALSRLAEVESIYQTAPVGLAVLDEELRFQRINQHLAEINGKTIEEHIGHSVREVVPHLADKIEPLLREILETGTPLLNIEVEGETLAQPGVLRTWLESWYPLRTENGSVNGINIVCQEITERKQFELAHQQFEQRLIDTAEQLESALVAGSVHTWCWDIPSGLVTVNAAFAELFGMDVADATTTSLPMTDFLEAIHLEDYARVSAELQKSIENDEAFICEYRVKPTQGEERWVASRGQVSYDSSGEPLAFRGVLADITKRKRAEEDRDRFFELSRDMLAVINVDGYFVQINPAWTNRLGYSKQELLACPYLDFVHPDDREATAREAESLSQGQPTTDFQNRYRCKDGTYCWLSWSVTPYLSQNILYAIAHDVTHRKQTELEREKLLAAAQSARKTAERANRIKDDFLAVLSHELRTPLNPILGWAQILKQKGLDSERSQKGLSAIERNARLQVQLVDDLLDVSRILRGKLALDTKSVDLKDVVQNAIETTSLAADAKEIKIKVDFETQAYQVKGDSGRLQQVVWNLLSNAVKFTPNGGEVIVRLRKIGKSIQLQVIDTGSGISSDFLPHVFEHFRQADGTTTREFGGLGLGLAIASKILEMHGSTISVNSAGEGKGATFTVVMSALLDEQVAASEDRTSSPLPEMDLPLLGLKLLVADDEPDSLEISGIFLEQAGAEVVVVNSAPAALEVLSEGSIDGLICDIAMPEMDGYQLIEKVRAMETENGQAMPAIALTAYVGDAAKERAETAGFQAHIAKPVDATELIQQVVKLCRFNEA